MKPVSLVSTLFLYLVSAVAFAADKPEDSTFIFDTPDVTVPIERLDNRLAYDAGMVAAFDGFWMAWLEFEPEQGDHLWIGRQTNDGWKDKQKVSAEPGQYAHPTPVLDAQGRLWLTYEKAVDKNWDIWARRRLKDGTFGPEQQISHGAGPDINHNVAPGPGGSLCIVWQSEQDGQFDILARRIDANSLSSVVTVSESAYGDWRPDVTTDANGDSYIVWDSFDGESYNVLARAHRNGEWSEVFGVAETPAFEAYAQIADDGDAGVWISWEEDGRNWGQTYRARQSRGSVTMGDEQGPLHRFRRLRLVHVNKESGRVYRPTALPMPQFKAASQRENRPENVRYTGVFYERGQLTVDGDGKPWIFYRHYYAPFLGCVNTHHVDQGWGMYGRTFTAKGWSDLYRFKAGQGDGMQRMVAAPTKDGLLAAWTTGRTDRRKSKQPRGVAWGKISHPGANPESTDWAGKLEPAETSADRSAFRPRPQTQLDDQSYTLFFGDLHRHTDLSLCRVQSDGTIEDTYRYASDPAGLDFLGITDHTRDIDRGDALSQLWWRCRKEVDRHALGETFIPFYSYERSGGGADHNVISLRPDMLRPHQPPLHHFWEELGDDTFTIPHQPFRGNLWEHKDNQHRPLLEIYQGCRDASKEAAAAEGLNHGHRFGFIASSDHMSTGASYAAVWAKNPTRESIFRAMQSRRTFGATSKIELKVTIDEHWMGEHLHTARPPVLQIEAKGTDTIERIDLLMDGAQTKQIEVNAQSINLRETLNDFPKGLHSVYVRLHQQDGNRAWSSPFWIDYKWPHAQ